MDNLTNSECFFCLISVARNVTRTLLLTRSQQCSFSDGSRTRQMFVHADNSYCFSAHTNVTREFAPSKCADVSDNTCTAQSTRKGSLDPSFPELALQQVHRAPHTIFARLTCAEE